MNPGPEFPVVGGAMILLAATQAVVSTCFLYRLWRRPPREKGAAAYTPKAVVILPLRGTDPSLIDTLQGLLRQDYPNFSIIVTFDSDEDPAGEVLQKFLMKSDPANVEILILTDHLSTCSLKCGAIAETIRQLKSDCEVIAFIDADAPPHPDWLRDLVAPLEDKAIGVVTGNRWFIPGDQRWGTITRYLWNAAAVVHVWMNRIAWAGSMAMRAELARDCELLNAWEHALSVDATVTRFVKSRGLDVHFAPTVMIPNRESIGLPQFRKWVERQLIAARSSGSGWFLVSLHTFSVIVIQFTAVLLLMSAVACSEPRAAAWVGIGLLAYWLTNLIVLFLIEKAVRRILWENAVTPHTLPARVLFRLFPAMIVSLAVYGAAFLRSTFKRRIKWRGVEYSIGAKNEIRMTGYHPFVNTIPDEPEDSLL